MWDNINLLINKKRLSSHIEKLQVENETYEQPFTVSNCLNSFFLYATMYLQNIIYLLSFLCF